MKRNMFEHSKVLTRERTTELRPREKSDLKQWTQIWSQFSYNGMTCKEYLYSSSIIFFLSFFRPYWLPYLLITSSFNRNTLLIEDEVSYISDIWTKIRRGKLEASGPIVNGYKDSLSPFPQWPKPVCQSKSTCKIVSELKRLLAP